MKSRPKKVVALFTAMLLVAVVLLPVLAACNRGGGTEEDPNPTYTYNEYISQFPSTWNTHNGTTDADTYIQGYTEIGLYDFTLSADRTTYAFIDEMATGDPVNVTNAYVGRYGITSADTGSTSLGKAWEITLNPDATWENGEAITAEDYVWSMERVLSPDMKNSAAATYITGDYAIYNASNYYNAGSAGNYMLFDTALSEEEVSNAIAERNLYFSITDGTPIMGALSLKAYHDLFTNNANYFKEDQNPDNLDWLVYLEETYGDDANEFGYILVTEENVDDIRAGMTILAENLPSAIADWTLTLSYLQTTHPVYTQIFGTTYTDDQLSEMVSNGELFLSLTQGIVSEGFSYSLSEWHRMSPTFWQDEDGTDYYTVLEEAIADQADASGYIQITADNYSVIQECLGVLYNNMTEYIPSWYCSLFIRTFEENTSVEFSEVGIFATNDNKKFVLVFENPLSAWDVKYLLTDNWLVYRPYYEAGYSQQGSLTVTSYGTTSGQYMSYGPYRLANYQVDSQITFERNSNWYGYKDGSTNYHAGQFQTDRIVCRIIEDQNTALLQFESGNLDTVRLNANNMDQYRFSDYLLTRSASNTWSITFNSDAELLAGIESDNLGNRRILAVEDFRRAISLSIDRAYIGSNILAGSASAYSFINSNYYYDMENDPNSIYRNSEQAMEAIVRLYGIKYGEGEQYATLEQAYRSISGYDEDAAREAFRSAYTTATGTMLEDGTTPLYRDGESIRINIYNNATSTQITALATYIQNCINAATADTPFEGKVTVEIRTMQTGRYDAIAQGRIEAIYYSFAGEYNDPNGMLANFTDADVQTILECGFDPAVAAFSLTYDFDGNGTIVDSEDPATNETDVTMTYESWQRSLNAGGKYAEAPMDTKLTIMAELEYRLLSGFRTLPLVVGTDLTLRSMKVNYATNTSNIFAMYGGVRLMTYNYTDTQWAEFIRNPGNLVYE